MCVPTLPHEIIIDVLSRLPVKTLMRFRCVCKSWCSLISDPYFINLHLKGAMTNVGSHKIFLSTFQLQSIACDALADDHPPSVMIDLDSRFMDQDVEIAGSCNGLICLVFDDINIVLFNPSTRSYKELPKPHLCFKGSFAHGLGYDSLADDYKLVRIGRPENPASSGNTQVEVFTLKTNYWRKIQIHEIHLHISLIGEGTFSNGALHWIVSEKAYQVTIVSFQLATEEFQELVPLPLDHVQTDIRFSICSLNVLDGCLSIVRNYLDLDHEIWVMKDYGVQVSWTKLFTFSSDETAPQYEYLMEPIYISKNGEVVLDVDGRGLVMYNPKNKTFRSIAIEGEAECDWFETATYVESLVSPNGNALICDWFVN